MNNSQILTFLNQSNPRPRVPTRREACSIHTGFQGRYYYSKTYSANYLRYYGGTTGQIPYFGGAYQDFYAVGDGPQILDQIIAAKDTHCMITHGRGGPGYNEANQPYGIDQLIPPANQTDKQFLAMADYVISRTRPVFLINGEGQPGYNEIKNTFADQIKLLRTGYDRTEYGPCLVVYDGVWPDSWSVDQMMEIIPFMRSVLGDKGYLGFMYANGPNGEPYLWVKDQGDYKNPVFDGLDIVVTSSGPTEAECVSMANKAKYMVQNPNYTECSPEGGHFIFYDNSRGERYWGNLEWNTYGTVRDPNQLLKPSIDAARQRMINMNVPIWG